MEFENILNEKIGSYILQKSSDGVDYWYEGNYKSVELLCKACFELGKRGYTDIKVLPKGV